MSAEFDGLKSVIGEAIVVLKSLSDKVGTSVQDPPAADIVAATQQLKTAVDAANAVLNPVPTPPVEPPTPAAAS